MCCVLADKLVPLDAHEGHGVSVLVIEVAVNAVQVCHFGVLPMLGHGVDPLQPFHFAVT